MDTCLSMKVETGITYLALYHTFQAQATSGMLWTTDHRKTNMATQGTTGFLFLQVHIRVMFILNFSLLSVLNAFCQNKR